MLVYYILLDHDICGPCEFLVPGNLEVLSETLPCLSLINWVAYCGCSVLVHTIDNSPKGDKKSYLYDSGNKKVITFIGWCKFILLCLHSKEL